MREHTVSGARLERSKKSRVTVSSASMLANSTQRVTSRRKCRQSISVELSHGLLIGRYSSSIRRPAAARSTAHDLIVLVGAGVVRCDIKALERVSIQQDLQELGHRAATLATARDDDRLAGVPAHRTEPIAAQRLRGRGNHRLLTAQAPHRAQRRMPAKVKLVGIVKDLVRSYATACFIDRLCLVRIQAHDSLL